MQGKVVIGVEADTKDFEKQIESLEKQLQTIEKRMANPKEYNLGKSDIEDLTIKAEKLKNKLVDLKRKQDDINTSGMSGVQESLGEVGNSLTGIIHKVTKWGLAIFGIRSAYSLVRQAMSTITSQDEQLKADIDYMKNVLAYMLEPVVRKIVELMKTLMFYVGYIAKAWFGVDIYSKASAKAMEAGTKSAKATTKELNKQLQKFDEMNVMQSQSGGGDSGGATPSFDLSNMNMEVPGWLKWLGENGEELIPILLGIAGALVAIELGASGVQATGIGIFIWAIIKAIKELKSYLEDPTWEKFANTVTYLGIAVAGLGLAFGSLPLIVIGVGIAITGLVAKYWDEVKDKFDEKIKELETSVDDVKKKFGFVIGDIYEGIVKFLRETYNEFDKHIKGVKLLFDGVIEFFEGVFSGDWSKAYKGLEKIAQGSLNVIVGSWKQTIGLVTSLGKNLGQAVGNAIADAIKVAINGVFWMIETSINSYIDSLNGILNVASKLGINVKKVGQVRLPRLAQGGIVNNPGRGVLMGSYIAGENGAEAVLPLTDDTLQRLANMIPITVNVTNTMNGRVISRELSKVQNENNFAFNR